MQSEVIRAINAEDSPCCAGVTAGEPSSSPPIFCFHLGFAMKGTVFATWRQLGPQAYSPDCLCLDTQGIKCSVLRESRIRLDFVRSETIRVLVRRVVAARELLQ